MPSSSTSWRRSSSTSRARTRRSAPIARASSPVNGRQRRERKRTLNSARMRAFLGSSRRLRRRSFIRQAASPHVTAFGRDAMARPHRHAGVLTFTSASGLAFSVAIIVAAYTAWMASERSQPFVSRASTRPRAAGAIAFPTRASKPRSARDAALPQHRPQCLASRRFPVGKDAPHHAHDRPRDHVRIGRDATVDTLVARGRPLRAGAT